MKLYTVPDMCANGDSVLIAEAIPKVKAAIAAQKQEEKSKATKQTQQEAEQ